MPLALAERLRTAYRALAADEPIVKRSAQWFDAAKQGSRLASWFAPSTDFAAADNPPVLRNRSRDAYRNYAFARRAVDVMVAAVVNTGIRPALRLEDSALKRLILSRWEAWTDSADLAERFDFYGLQAQALRSLLTDGELLVRLLVSPEDTVPLRLQLLTPEFLDTSRDNQTDTAGGIEFNAQGRRVAYWIYPKHPAETPSFQSNRVPASEVLHLFSPLQPGFERGTSWLAPALLPLRELMQYTEGELVRMRISGLFAAFVQTPDASSSLGEKDGTPIALEPGSISRMKPGETIEFSKPEVTDQFEPFVRTQLRAIAGALNIPYSDLSGDLSQTTFASGRAALIEFRRQVEALQHHLMVFQFCRPVWALWLRLGVLAGALPEAAATIPAPRWIAPLPASLDARMEVEADVRRVRAGFTSQSEVIAMNGWDADSVAEEIAADNARARRLGLVFDTDPAQVSQQGQQQPTEQESVDA